VVGVAYDLRVDIVLKHFREPLAEYGILRGGSMLDIWHRSK
jgi:hypothetical protein